MPDELTTEVIESICGSLEDIKRGRVSYINKAFRNNGIYVEYKIHRTYKEEDEY